MLESMGKPKMLESMGKPKMHIRIFEDNQATIKVLQNGWSPNLVSTGKVHKVDIGSLHEQICENW